MNEFNRWWYKVDDRNSKYKGDNNMIDKDNLALLRKVWSNIDKHDYSALKACHLHELVRILNLAREEGRAEVRSGRSVVRVQSR